MTDDTPKEIETSTAAPESQAAPETQAKPDVPPKPEAQAKPEVPATRDEVKVPSVFEGDQNLSSIDAAKPTETEPREKTRSKIAFTLIWTLTGTIAFSLLVPFIGYLLEFDKQVFSDVLRTVFPPLVALVGSVIGFYYGSHSR